MTRPDPRWMPPPPRRPLRRLAGNAAHFLVGAVAGLLALAMLVAFVPSAFGQGGAAVERPPAAVFLTVGDEAGWAPGNFGIGPLAEALRTRGHSAVWSAWRDAWAHRLRPGYDTIFVHNPGGFAHPGRGMRVDQLLALPEWLQREVVGLVGDMRADGHRVVVYLGHPAPHDERLSLSRLVGSFEPFTELSCALAFDATSNWRSDAEVGAFFALLRARGVEVLPETNDRETPSVIDSNWLAGEDAQRMPVAAGSIVLPYGPSVPGDDSWREWWPAWWRAQAERGRVAAIRPWYFSAQDGTLDDIWKRSEPLAERPTPVALLLGVPASTPFGFIDGAASAVGGIDRVEIDGAVVPLTHGAAFEWRSPDALVREIRIDAWGRRGGHASATVTINDTGRWLVIDAASGGFVRSERVDTGGRGLWLRHANLDGPVRPRLATANTAPIVLDHCVSDGEFGNLAEPAYWRGGIYVRGCAFRGGVVVAPMARAWVACTLADMQSEGFHGAALVLDCTVEGIRKPSNTAYHPDLVQVPPPVVGDVIVCGLRAREVYAQGVFTRAASGEPFSSLHLIACDVDQRSHASQLLRSCADLRIIDCRFWNAEGEARPFYIANDAHPTRFERVEVRGLEAPGFKCDLSIVPIDVWLRRTLDDDRVVIDGSWEAAR